MFAGDDFKKKKSVLDFRGARVRKKTNEKSLAKITVFLSFFVEAACRVFRESLQNFYKIGLCSCAAFACRACNCNRKQMTDSPTIQKKQVEVNLVLKQTINHLLMRDVPTL